MVECAMAVQRQRGWRGTEKGKEVKGKQWLFGKCEIERDMVEDDGERKLRRLKMKRGARE